MIEADTPSEPESDDAVVLADLEGRLLAVEDALDRLEEGSYGRCSICGEALEPERLADDPLARCCGRCAEAKAG